VDVDSFAFLNCFEEGYKPQRGDCVALLNVGAEITNINIYSGGTSRFSRDISIAGNAITQAIAQKAGVPWAKAEQLKLALGAPQPEAQEESAEEESSLISSIRGTVERMTGSDLGDDSAEGVAAKAIRNTLVSLVGEVRRSLQFFENQGGQQVSRVLMGGGSSRMANLANFLTSELEITVETFDPLKGIRVGSGVDGTQLGAAREHLAVGIGLALRKAG
jgi:type IV pilus assembly protein PilM